MVQPRSHVEHNTNNVTGSTVNGSPIVAGPGATVSGSQIGSTDEQQVQAAIAELRSALEQALSSADEDDDETLENLELAGGRLARLEKELRTSDSAPDPERVNKLLAGIRDAVAGVTGLLVSVDGLWGAVDKIVT